MNRIIVIALASASLFRAAAQGPVSSIVIGSNYKWAQFYVDGQIYSGTATFTWPQGSKHTVQFINNLNALTAGCANSLATALQFSSDSTTVLAFTGWHDNTGKLLNNSDPVQTVTADPSITSLTASVSAAYLVQLQFFNSGSNAVGPTGLPNCQAPGPDSVPGDLRPGVVGINGQYYWGSAIMYLSGAQVINAFPYPGFVFNGWNINGNQLASYSASIVVQGPMTIVPQFVPGKRVRFITNPMGLKVLVDRTVVTTTPYLNTNDLTGAQTCPTEFQRAPAPPPGVPALCFGDFDFAPYSTHIISAPTPQIDISGKNWVFDSFDKGGGQNTVYTTDQNTGIMDTVTAKFVPGAMMAFDTRPVGLPITVDGRSNWPQQPSLVFTWALGSTHQISAQPTLTDNKGRKYTFQNWSNNGPATQSITVGQSDVDNGARMTAYYSVLSRLVVQTSPDGLTLNVDGAPCQSPCTIDRPNGTQVHVTAPNSIPVSDGARLDFASWSDSGAADHVYTISGDTQTLTANYQQMFRLSATTNPANGATFTFSPTSADAYYAANQAVTVTAQASAGFKFRRWGGDLSGTFPTGQVTITQPCSVVALLDKVPYIAPAGVQNAAGTTPDAVVAPGSIIAVFGASLTSGDVVVGPINPLSQTLDGVVVTVADRILPLLFVSPTQVNAQLPSDLPEGNYTLTISAPGQPDVTGAFTVARNAPGLFMWGVDSRPIALALHQDGTPITPDSPARQGETITLYGTGFGPTQQPLIAGFLLQNAPPNPLIDTVTIQLGDSFNPVPVFSGASPDYIGMEITKFQITPDLPSGTMLDLSITVNGRTSNTVKLPL